MPSRSELERERARRPGPAPVQGWLQPPYLAVPWLFRALDVEVAFSDDDLAITFNGVAEVPFATRGELTYVEIWSYDPFGLESPASVRFNLLRNGHPIPCFREMTPGGYDTTVDSGTQCCMLLYWQSPPLLAPVHLEPGDQMILRRRTVGAQLQTMSFTCGGWLYPAFTELDGAGRATQR